LMIGGIIWIHLITAGVVGGVSGVSGVSMRISITSAATVTSFVATHL
jgi:hypothetical protein